METPIPPKGEPQPAYTPFIPYDQDEKAALAVRLATAWQKNPQLTFLWTTQAQFAASATAYHQAVLDKNRLAAQRGTITMTLEEADEKIDAGMPYLKAALLTRFKKGGDKAKYAEFGIQARNKGYSLPTAHTERVEALKMLTDSLVTYDLTEGEYGSAYWNPIEAAYRLGDTAARGNASGVSTLQGTKSTHEEPVDRVLTKMLTLLDAQYPTEATLAAKRREMGYLREYN